MLLFSSTFMALPRVGPTHYSSLILVFSYHHLCLTTYHWLITLIHITLLFPLQPCLTYIHLHYIAPILWYPWRGLVLLVDPFLLSSFHLATLFLFWAWNIVTCHFISLGKLTFSIVMLVKLWGGIFVVHLYLFFINHEKGIQLKYSLSYFQTL